MPSIKMYVKPWCPYCRRAKSLLDGKGLAYDEIDVTEDPLLEAEMIRRSGRTTAPQIFVDERHIGDSDHLAYLENEGRLDEVLGLEPSKERDT
jgi:glutaredoxin 3